MRDQRLRRGWTQEGLAQRCWDKGIRVSDSQISKIERGVCMPDPGLRAVLSKLLDLDIDLQKIEVKS